MPVRIDIQFDDAAIRSALDRLARAGSDLSPAMREIAGHLEDSAAESFEQESAPDGAPWAPLAESTKKDRRRRGYRDGPILERSGDLGASITSDSDATSAVAGTNFAYAARHQLGFEGPDSLGRNIDTPARPFLGLWPEHKDLVVEAIHRHFTSALK